MTRLQEKAQGLTKQFVGEMIGDDKLAEEGRRQEQDAKQDEAAQDKADGKLMRGGRAAQDSPNGAPLTSKQGPGGDPSKDNDTPK
jgi:uncharacterized protein YjbJ (UPF0337 family)